MLDPAISNRSYLDEQHKKHQKSVHATMSQNTNKVTQIKKESHTQAAGPTGTKSPKGVRSPGPVGALIISCICLSLLNVVLIARQIGDTRTSPLEPVTPVELLNREAMHPRPKVEVLSWEPRIFQLKNVITQQQCEALIRRAEPRLEHVGTFATAKKKTRTSESMWFSSERDDQDDVVATIRAVLLDSVLMPR
jgi:hypothetical protein